jgi:hypothetical protein
MYRRTPTVIRATVAKRDVASVILRVAELILFNAEAAKVQEAYHIEPHPATKSSSHNS